MVNPSTNHAASPDKHPKSHENMMDSEAHVKRNPHPDFKKVEASRPGWRSEEKWKVTQTKNTDWTWGSGPNDTSHKCKNHREVDPYAEGRPSVWNYKLLISGIIPRPIGFLSTMSKDGKTTNLAPFSYFNVINHDPPLFIVSFAGGLDRAKDSCKNIIDTEECCVNIISEHIFEAANATSINAPFGISEFDFTGLEQAPCSTIKPPRVKDAIFSIETKLVETRQFESKVAPGKKTNVLVILEGTRFWIREDATNEEASLIDPAVLKPMARMGGITYGRQIEGVELPRLDWNEKTEKEVKERLRKENL